MTADPKITVLMPVHNGEPFLREAVESILGQTYGGFELLVVDDGSTDGSAAIVLSFGDPRIRLVANPANAGIVASLNRGLALARGEYVARMDCDDVSLPRRLERQVAFLSADPGVGVLGTGYETVDRDGNMLETLRHPPRHEILLWSLFFYNPIAHPTVMMRREAVLSAGGYRSEDYRGRGRFFPEDYDLWWRLSRVTRLANLPEILVRLRKHGGNLMAVHGEEYLENAARICRGMLAERLGREVAVETAKSLLRRRCRSRGEVDAAIEAIRDLYGTFMRPETLSGDARREVRAEAAAIILELLRLNAGHIRARDVLGWLSRHGGFVPRCAAKGVAQKIGARLRAGP
jgi:glycosyltransferase involved in cell wall biosynthesis